MEYPPVFLYAAASPAVTAILGAPPAMRFWPAGHAKQESARPYATHGLVVAVPENTLSCPPSVDKFSLQIDCFAKDWSAAWALMGALRSALEPDGYINTIDIDEWDNPTGLYRVSFSVDFWQER